MHTEPCVCSLQASTGTAKDSVPVYGASVGMLNQALGLDTMIHLDTGEDSQDGVVVPYRVLQITTHDLHQSSGTKLGGTQRKVLLRSPGYHCAIPKATGTGHQLWSGDTGYGHWKARDPQWFLQFELLEAGGTWVTP